ncbi:MAG: septum formation protein Maf [Betaproteobacteria bacterium]|nr:septum formation protein Maf [Betaproteobacteria bacterium]
MPDRPLILASTSAYRRDLLARLRLPFQTEAPDVDETPLADEPPERCAARLAIAKASIVARRNPTAVVIGSDQVAALGDLRLGKPGDRENAIAQLRAASGRTVAFHTGLSVVSSGGARESVVVDTTLVRFRTLDDRVISRYVDLEQPFDCAGSAKSEGLGIALLASIRGDDPTSLIGLPLVRLTEMLADHGISVL